MQYKNAFYVPFSLKIYGFDIFMKLVFIDDVWICYDNVLHQASTSLGFK